MDISTHGYPDFLSVRLLKLFNNLFSSGTDRPQHGDLPYQRTVRADLGGLRLLHHLWRDVREPGPGGQLCRGGQHLGVGPPVGLLDYGGKENHNHHYFSVNVGIRIIQTINESLKTR